MSPHKYHAKRTEVDGIKFASKAEARRYGELKLLERARQIRALRLQPRYALCGLVVDGADCRDVNVGAIVNTRRPIAQYVADFEYEEPHPQLPQTHWRVVVEDVKGVLTETYKLKKRLFEALTRLLQTQEREEDTRVAPLTECADGQDLPRSGNEPSPPLPSGRTR